jgi:ABC-type multidrug transport system fused ATPase/permease subunit
MPAVGLVAWLFAHKVMPISREVQQRKGDVTESADEAVVGIEMVQAFGREEDVRGRFAGKATAVRDTSSARPASSLVTFRVSSTCRPSR